MKLLLPALVALCAPAFAGIVHVDRNLSSGANDGSTWANAFQGVLGLQSALSAAQPGDQIWVAQGAYEPGPLGTHLVSFVLRSGVEVYGGFAGGETQLAQRDFAAHLATLDGDLAHDDDLHQFNDNIYVVVSGGTADSSALLDGFTIQGGIVCGIRCSTGTTAGFRNCVVRANRCNDSGAGLQVDGASPRFHFTRFEDNRADWGGGAFYATNSSLLSFTGCTFVGNHAGSGGAGRANGVLSLNFVNCAFQGNVVDGPFANTGGGALLLQACGTTLEDCTVAGNTATGFTSCGGVYNYSGSTSLSNCIVYFNQGYPGSTQSQNLMGASATWSCIQGGYPGTANTSADPRLVDLAGGNLRLRPDSPCIDAGNNSLVPGTGALDADGLERFVDDGYVADTGVGTAPVADLGAYELPEPLFMPFCSGDGSLATACPCGNFGLLGRGCLNSDIFSLGARLEASGSSHPDALVLDASEMLASSTCVFLQGTQSNGNGAVFGDGVRCVAGVLKRLYVKTASGGAASAPGAGDAPVTSRSAALGDVIAPGSMRTYQTYYRDPDPFFCAAPQGSTWNVTNGVIVHW